MSNTDTFLEQQIRSLYSTHHGWLCRRLGCPHHAPDLAQDTFVRVMLRDEVASLREPRACLTIIARGLGSRAST